jgi:pimeloyl-ACP methyl ester carboxylesterase
MPEVRNDGVRINYEVAGRGSPLVLQHGFFWSLEGWKRTGYVDALKEQYQLILIDARGHGKSDKPHTEDDYQLERLIADVTSVLDRLDIERAHFWGFSMGGYYAYGMATHAPNRLRSLIIGAAGPQGRSMPQEGKPTGDNAEKFVATFLERMGLDRNDFSKEQFSEFFDNDFHALSASLRDRPALEATLPRIQVPCLLYVGDKDGACERVSNCVANIPNAKLVVLPGLNHPQAFYRSDLVIPHVKEFLRQADAH